MRSLLVILGCFTLIYCKASSNHINFAVNPTQGSKKILLGDFRQKTNIPSMSLGKLAKEFAVIELMKEGYRVEVFETNNDPILIRKEETKLTAKNTILKAAGEQNERIFSSEMVDSSFVADLGKEKNFDYFLQGKLHIYKEEFKSNSFSEVIAYMTVSNSEGLLVAAVSSKKTITNEVSSEDIYEVVSSLVKKIPQVGNK
ncbi:hypothetical protein [Leptospira bouyouniensis]|uniref:Lipoprotein n=1 Tax=Leptospira bouyouniensis TaxID=2484911 RepID=A0ABY2KYY4_9LEPT|nr:hypothetical protein [Leptospira bouyouniensis]TGK45443.1 hypothetical protein EHQ10_19140 [Leptospira bouyouniensis]